MGRWPAVALCLLAAACGDSDEKAPPPPPPASGCAISEVMGQDGSCIAPGVPEEACGLGFVSDGTMGCLALLPATPCPEGQMAVPGEEACRPVSPCADGTWGDIAVDATTQYVDGSYLGADSDGSASRPWTTIQQAITVAPPNGIVAIAAGTYTEQLQVAGKPVRLWGRCPELVELRAVAVDEPAILYGPGSDGSVMRALGFWGGAHAVHVLGGADITIESSWIRETNDSAVYVSAMDPGSVIVRGSLIERFRGYGVYPVGAAATVETSVIRGARMASFGVAAGLWVQDLVGTGERGSLTVRQSLLEDNEDLGIFVGGSDVVVQSTVIRDTLPVPATGLSGRAFEVIDDPTSGQRAVGRLEASVLERSLQEGVFVAGSDLVVDATVVRDVYPRASDLLFGRGISMEPDPTTAAPSSLVVTRSLVERTHEIGVFVSFGSSELGQVRVRDTLPRGADGRIGRAVDIQNSLEGPGAMVMRSSLVERAFEVGIFAGTTFVLENSAVTGVLPDTSTGLAGDGVFVLNVPSLTPAGPQVDLSLVSIHDSARAGVANLDGAVSIVNSVLDCNPLDLNGERLTDAYAFADLGGNRCGCGDETRECRVSQTKLEPPQPL